MCVNVRFLFDYKLVLFCLVLCAVRIRLWAVCGHLRLRVFHIHTHL